MPAFLQAYRSALLAAGFFSLCLNLLLLVPALYTLQLFDRVLSSRSVETLTLLSAFVLGALVFMAALDILRGRLMALVGLGFDRRMSPDVMAEVLSAADAGGDTTRAFAMRDVSHLRTFLGGQPILSLFDLPWLPIYMLVVFLLHPLLGVAALGGALVLLALAIYNDLRTRRAIEDAQTAGRRMSRFVDACQRRADVVMAHGMLGAMQRRWMTMNDAGMAPQLSVAATGATIAGLTRLVRQAIQVVVLGVGAWLVIRQTVTPGVMIAASILLARALQPMEGVVANWRALVEARAAWGRLRRLLDGVQARSEVPKVSLPAPKGELAVEQVALLLPGVERPVLRGISFALHPGQVLGVIGPSGAGKSTLCRLLIGLVAPSSGTVRLDGADIAQWPRAEIGPHLGYLPQDAALFAGTVGENIARMGAVDSDAVVDAARRARVHELVLSLPNGYDTLIGENGAPLSMGQQQRIALARTLYGGPRLVVLDEPNANLDGDGELALAQTIDDLKREQATVVVVSHRPGLIERVDRILMLRDGQVELCGPAGEVLSRIRARAGTAPRVVRDAGTKAD
jgi:ATP-binding cassette subfamily C exporter for protease/lipase/ATP-binding cassette subfamily C protein EexD